jgi:quercetin dioxygenase-like cupin family protein
VRSRLDPGSAVAYRGPLDPVATVAGTSQELKGLVRRDPLPLRRGKLVEPGEGISVWWEGDDRLTFPAVSEETGGEYAFWLDAPPAGTGPPKHVHSGEEEGFFVIKGTVELQAGRVRETVGDGAFFAAPCGIPHRWRNVGDGTAQLITFVARGGLEGLFLGFGTPGDEAPREPETIPLDEMNARARRYGVTYLESGPDPLEGALLIGEGRSPTVVLAGQGERRYAAGATYEVKAAGLATAGAYTAAEIVLEPGGGVPGHRHARYEEALYVLEGTVTAVVDGERYEASAGAFVLVPWGVHHQLYNHTDQRVRLFDLTVPGGIEEYYRSACRPLPGPLGDPDGDLQRLAVVGRQFGIDVDRQPLMRSNGAA